MTALAMHRPKQHFKIEGMDCASCATTIHTALSGLPGIDDVSVSVARERLSLTLDTEKIAREKLEKIVMRLGFKPTFLPEASNETEPSHGSTYDHADIDGCYGHAHGHASSSVRGSADETPAFETDNKHVFRIEGMDCGSCAATISTALSGSPGLTYHNVSVSREILTVGFDPSQTTTQDIKKIVTGLGFQLHLASPTSDVSVKPNAWWRTSKVGHLFVSIALAVIASQLVPVLGTWLFTTVVLFALFPIAKRALVAAQLGAIFTIQMLMTIAAIGAVFIGEQEEALLVILLFICGELLEGLAAEKARSGIKALDKLLPKQVYIDDNGTIRQVSTSSLQIGQIVVSRPGDRIAADGEIIEGMSSIDESAVTGESIPVNKAPGERAFAGTVNHDAVLRLRVDRVPEDNTIARIISMVEQAQDSKAPTERFIEAFSKIYMPIILGLAAVVAFVPPMMGVGTWDTWIYRALALLLIGCPCALVISVPAAIASSLSAGARHGILIKGGDVIEEIARAKRVVFDKTGTLTEGKPLVTDVVAHNGDEASLIALAAGIERESSHPLAEAIASAAERRGIAATPAQDVRVVPGKGMEGTIARVCVFVGAPRFAAEKTTFSDAIITQIDALESDGKTVAVVIAGAEFKGLIALRDQPREDARTGLLELNKIGIKALMMTGDNARTGAAVAKDLGIEVMAEMLPETKAARVRELVKTESVIMVGDGVNDAPALAEASVGVAIGSGTDVAMEAADAALMRNSIGDVAKLINLSKATMSNIRQNVIIALGLKAVFLVTTVTGISGLWMAVLADTGATVLVTLNAMRLLGYLGIRKST